MTAHPAAPPARQLWRAAVAWHSADIDHVADDNCQNERRRKLTDPIIDRVADWLDGVEPADGSPPPEIWACCEIFGHRKHYGRIREVERFGTKMLRIDVPVAADAPLLGEAEQFETFLYGGGSIFSLTPMTEEAARQWAARERGGSIRPMNRLPPPDYSDEFDDDGNRSF